MICLDHGLYAGLGNGFYDIFSLPSYYRQALRGLALGVSVQNEPGLFLYSQYYLQDIKKVFTASESSAVFCHPKMQMLLNYDSRHSTELSRSFYMYLVHERNISATAKAMFVHRSTLIYRLKRIYSLLAVSDESAFDDYLERRYLILSYEMNS